MATVLVGSARIDENGNISGGQAGDQTGKEVCTQEWYPKPWDFMAIHPDANVRELHAQAVEQACDNENIGYDQNQRNTLNTQAALVDYIIKNIKTKCECDCSSLQNVAAIASGAEKASNYGSNGWTTSSMKSALKALGYIIITASTYLTSASYCVRGAIYVKAGSHTVAGLTNGSNYKKTLEKAGVSEETTVTAQPDTIWNYLYKKIGNAYGAAGLMGNLYAESGLLPNNLQDSYESKLGYTDVTYTEAVDDGKYTKFASDSAGYGLAQWTYKTRKQALLDYCQSMKSSIGDLDCQLEFLIAELQADFASVWKSLKNATSVKEASDIVLTKFEQPADQSDSVKTKRANYGQNYYDKYVGGSSGTTSSTDKLTVDGEIGPKTVKRLQQFCGLTQTGTIGSQPSSGKQYWTSILSSVVTWSSGKSDTVRAFQKYLYDKGYKSGVNFKDGKLGKNTAKCAQEFLKDKGYYTGSIDSIFGTQSAKALQTWLNK